MATTENTSKEQLVPAWCDWNIWDFHVRIIILLKLRTPSPLSLGFHGLHWVLFCLSQFLFAFPTVSLPFPHLGDFYPSAGDVGKFPQRTWDRKIVWESSFWWFCSDEIPWNPTFIAWEMIPHNLNLLYLQAAGQRCGDTCPYSGNVLGLSIQRGILVFLYLIPAIPRGWMCQNSLYCPFSLALNCFAPQ